MQKIPQREENKIELNRKQYFSASRPIPDLAHLADFKSKNITHPT